MTFFRIPAPFSAATTALLLASLVLLDALAPTGVGAQSVLQTSRSHDGAVATAHPLATEAGVRMLELGGNAADAAVAAAFAIAVVEPAMNSIGGRNQILIRLPDGVIRGIDATTQAPATYDPDTAPQASYGYPVVGVPGAAAGLLRLHRELGSLPLATVMAPAIDYAANGYRLLPGEANREADEADQSREFPATAAIYLKPDGTPRDPGEMLVQKDYANTLREIAAGGADAFYKGDIARKIAADMQAHGGAVTLQSLAEYRAEDARIVRGSYRGYEIVGMDVPSAGVVCIQALQIMETFDPGSMTEAQWAAVKGQALGLAARELRGLGSDTAAARATSKAWARQQATRVRAPARARPMDPDAMASAWAHAAADTPDHLPVGPDDQGHTTHLTVADGHGMFVALTQTLGPTMGSSVVTPGLGFLYAATLGGYLGRVEAGERARSSISPLLVLKDGEPVLALGAAGGGRIPPGIVQVISRIVDEGMTLSDALAAPRVYMSGSTLEAETSPGTGWTPGEVAEMRALGLEVRENPGVGSFSRVHAIQYDASSNTWIGGADPDWEGSAQAPDRPRPPGEARR
ncbi:MAG TPA: gamma-glutamyltransferase [Longimicrobiales bacterium]|nr:gamma-glutamyltransferase [Longimicrobiales bacterium]